MIVGGNVKRLEDVKKYIYAGAKKTFLMKNNGFDLIEEASHRFGSDNIAFLLENENDLDFVKKIEDLISLVISDTNIEIHLFCYIQILLMEKILHGCMVWCQINLL